MTLKARVHNGRFVLGRSSLKELRLISSPLDPGDWLDLENRAILHRALAASQEDLEDSRIVDAEAVLRELWVP